MKNAPSLQIRRSEKEATSDMTIPLCHEIRKDERLKEQERRRLFIRWSVWSAKCLFNHVNAREAVTAGFSKRFTTSFL